MNVNLKIAAYLTGTLDNPRLMWGVGVPAQFVDSLNLTEDDQRVKLHAEDGKLFVNFDPDGIKLTRPRPTSSVAYANRLGIHHITGLNTPEEPSRGISVVGSFNGESIIVEDPPEIIKRAMAATTKAPKSEDDQFPGTHFVEDVQKAAGKAATSVTALLNDQVEHVSDHDHSALEGARAWLEGLVERSKRGVVTEQVEITTALAEALLERNDGNRPLRPAKLEQYTNDVRDGRWQFNGETIIISDDGKLNNGQHRLHAVIRSGKPIETLLVFGVKRETRATVDTGASRGAQDYLALDGYKQPTTLAAATRFAIAWERNNYRGFANLNRITNLEVINRAKADPLLEDAAIFPYSHSVHKAKRLAPPSVIAFCYYAFASKDKQAATEFMDQMILGINLEANSPAYIVREKLLELSSLYREQKIEVIMRGWNAFRKGSTMRNVRIYHELPPLK